MRRVPKGTGTAAPERVDEQLEHYRRELTAYCYRMLASPFEAEDAVQETLIRAWRAHERFEGRAALRSWLYRIATNVCLDMLSSRERRARPMDLGPAGEPVIENLHVLPEVTWVEPLPTAELSGADPADAAIVRETVRLAFVAALQHLPPRQRAALILCEVLRWKAAEAAELLDTSVASVNSALQRARATLDAADLGPVSDSAEEADPDLLARYVAAFEAYDMDALTSLIHEDAQQSMPPFDLWLRGRDDIFTWWYGPGGGCRGSKVVPAPAGAANGSPAFGQYKPSEDRRGLRAVGAPGARDPRRQDRGADLLPRHGEGLPAVRAPARVRRPAGLSSRHGPARQVQAVQPGSDPGCRKRATGLCRMCGRSCAPMNSASRSGLTLCDRACVPGAAGSAWLRGARDRRRAWRERRLRRVGLA